MISTPALARRFVMGQLVLKAISLMFGGVLKASRDLANRVISRANIYLQVLLTSIQVLATLLGVRILPSTRGSTLKSLKNCQDYSYRAPCQEGPFALPLWT